MQRRYVLQASWAAAVGAAMPMAASAQGLPLHAAAASNDAARIHELLRNGADIEARDAQGRSPLLVATHGNCVDAARALIEGGADVNAKDALQDSAYLYAGARGYVEILRMTLANGADLASTNRFGGTALIPACERGHVEAVRLLLQAGVAVDHVNRLGWTGLLEVVILGDGGPPYQQIVQLLLDAGADVNLADSHGTTPLAHARQRGQTAVAALLTQAGAR